LKGNCGSLLGDVKAAHEMGIPLPIDMNFNTHILGLRIR
jgi:hypothetical protein